MLTIVGRHIHLREFRVEDARWLAAALRRGTWWRWDAPWEGPPAEERLRRIPSRIAALVDERAVPPRRMVIETRRATPIGSVSRYWVDENAQWMEVGIGIYQARHRSRGYGTEALALWVDHLFESLPLRRLGLRTWSGNERMVRAARRLGFVLEARFRQTYLTPTRAYDRMAFGLLRREWERARRAWRA